MAPLRDEATSPADEPLRFHIATSLLLVPYVAYVEIFFGVPVEDTVVGDDHVVYGELDSENETVPLSTNHAAISEVVP